MTVIEKVKKIKAHIANVQEFSMKIAEHLLILGEEKLALELISNAQIHDVSKFSGEEFEFLAAYEGRQLEQCAGLKEAILKHVKANKHHPECWMRKDDDAENNWTTRMPKVYVLEMIADWASRGKEMGGNLREWIDTKATVKYNFTKSDGIYHLIMYFVGILDKSEGK